MNIELRVRFYLALVCVATVLSGASLALADQQKLGMPRSFSGGSALADRAVPVNSNVSGETAQGSRARPKDLSAMESDQQKDGTRVVRRGFSGGSAMADVTKVKRSR